MPCINISTKGLDPEGSSKSTRYPGLLGAPAAAHKGAGSHECIQEG